MEPEILTTLRSNELNHAYYNEFDEQKAAWLRELIRAGVIAPGEVDERSISDVRASDLRRFTQCHFFAGIGIWSYALRLAGWPDDRRVWTGSCPCPSFSAAGKGLGFADPRHLWPEWYRLIREWNPPVLLGEQVEAAIGHGWLDLVASDLEREAYSVAAAVLPAASVGAWHNRPRVWFVADSERNKQRRKEPRCRKVGRVGRVIEPVSWDEPWTSALRRLRTLDDGNSYGVVALDGARDAIVPQVAAAFIESYQEARGLTS